MIKQLIKANRQRAVLRRVDMGERGILLSPSWVSSDRCRAGSHWA